MSFLCSFAECLVPSLMVILPAIVRQICIRNPNDKGTHSAQDGNTENGMLSQHSSDKSAARSAVVCLECKRTLREWSGRKLHMHTHTHTAKHFLPAWHQSGSILDLRTVQLKASSKWHFRTTCNANFNFSVFNKTLLRQYQSVLMQDLQSQKKYRKTQYDFSILAQSTWVNFYSFAAIVHFKETMLNTWP